jgi:hypothetical protein
MPGPPRALELPPLELLELELLELLLDEPLLPEELLLDELLLDELEELELELFDELDAPLLEAALAELPLEATEEEPTPPELAPELETVEPPSEGPVPPQATRERARTATTTCIELGIRMGTSGRGGNRTPDPDGRARAVGHGPLTRASVPLTTARDVA